MKFDDRFCKAISSLIGTAEEALDFAASSCSQSGYSATSARAREQLKQLADLRSVLMLELRAKETARDAARADLEERRAKYDT